ncbi:MAG TPA: 2-C-methyl-D-erythritol 4-phosphate cytidylyltransferase [Clostridiales bacterium]|nr:2-C-methyl-D-erythritol 4-phosphate cytidylyltransferase [Clostridiales bacterium]
MVSAVIFAGGVGARMKSVEIPKQFLEVDGKPIIIRTLENFQNHGEVDNIVISCLESWIDKLRGLVNKYNITKVRSIVPGGTNGHGSIHNGLVEVNREALPDDIVLICDGVRPLLSNDLISNCIKTAKAHETAVPVTPSIDSVLESQDGETCNHSLPRGEMFITQAPQGYTMRKIMWAHDEAARRGITNPISSSELLIELGEKVNIFIGDRDNIKVTTPEDLRFLRAYYYYGRYRHFAKEELEYGLQY